MVSTGEDAKLEVCTWDRARFARELSHARTNIHPEHWPDDVRVISGKGLSYLGLDSKGRLYLDGEAVYTVRRWSWVERTIASLGLFAAFIAAGATVVQAYDAWEQMPAAQSARAKPQSSAVSTHA